jgi:glutathione synthase/RimK-type ligase-like ATP-grasp enzyme
MNQLTNFADCQKLLAAAADPVLAVGNNAYHGLGLAELLDDPKIVCADDDYLSRQLQADGVKVFSLERNLGKQNVIFRSTAGLLRQPATENFLKQQSGQPQLYIPKPSPRLEKLAQAKSWRLLSSQAPLNRQFEDKIEFTKLLQETKISPAPRAVTIISVDNLRAAVAKFGRPLVVQFSRGLAGAGTYFLQTEDDLKKLAAQTAGRAAVIAKKLSGPTVTLNAVVIESGVVVGAPFLQISNEPQLNSHPGGTGGNDYAVDLKLTSWQRQQIFDQTIAAGEIMRRQGYRGLFGIDFIAGDKICMIEINARPTASVPTFTQLEKINQEIPLLGLHLLDWLQIPFQLDIASVNQEKFAARHQASKLIFRNTEPVTVTARADYKAGVYKISETGDLSWLRPATSVAALQNSSETLLWSVRPGKKVSPNIELATMILSRPVTDGQGRLLPEIKKIISTVKVKL